MYPWFLKFYDASGLVEKDGTSLPACSWFGHVPDSEFAGYLEAMEQAEQGGELDGLFKVSCRETRRMPDKGKFLDSLVSGMKLYKSTFMKIYGYDIASPGFASDALARLKAEGCSRAEEYYNKIISEWKEEHDRMMREVAAWHLKNTAQDSRNTMKGGENAWERKTRSRDQEWEKLSKILGFPSLKREN